MKTIGLIGGMSWESTVSYYRVINEYVKQGLGGLHSAKILLYSVDFAVIEACQAKGEWDRSGEILADAARRLEMAGADFLVICTNTMHKVVPQIEAAIRIPVLHIAEATGKALIRQGVKKALLLGTKYTMTQDFYKEKLIAMGIDVSVPDEADMERMNGIIFRELCLGKITAESRQECLGMIEKCSRTGIEGVIFGCTEIGLLVKPEDVRLPVFDTAQIHAEAAARHSLSGGE